MKVMIIGESPSMPSGFGTQCKLLAKGLSEKHEVVILSSAVGMPKPIAIEGVQEWPLTDIMNLEIVDKTVLQYEPDCVIVFWYIHMISHMAQLKAAPANCKMFFWVPWEGSTIPDNMNGIFYGMKGRNIVHLSKFASKLWKPIINSEQVISHCYNPVYETNGQVVDKRALRRKWSKKLKYPLFEDALIILNMDRNVRHKRWDAVYDYIKRLQKALPDREVQLIAHSKIKGEKVSGMGISGYDLEELERIYEIEDNVCYTGFDWFKGLDESELMEIIQLSDFRISMSMGEGFGIPVIECGRLGVPQIINNTTTMPELLGDSSFLVSPATSELDRGCLWQVPNVNGMVQQTIKLLVKKPELSDQVNMAQHRIADRFSFEKVTNDWKDLIEDDYYDPWIENRWGFQNEYKTRLIFKDLAQVIAKFDSPSVLEIGAFDGIFAEYALTYGIDYRGIEPESAAIDKASKRAQQNIYHQDYLSEWPAGVSILVVTDLMELLYEAGGIKAIQEFYERIKYYYRWLFIRMQNTYKKGVPLFDYSTVGGTYLESQNFHRRHDLEVMVTRDHELKLEHQIWEKAEDTSYTPPGLLIEK